MIIKFFFIFYFLIFIESKTKASTNCNHYTETIGKEYKIPNKLLTSISLVESGLKREKILFLGHGHLMYLKIKVFYSKAETVNYLKKTIIKKNIDVGCMQISLKYHGKNFENFNQILDPKSNVEYAAKFLRSLYSKHKTWNEAISRYHSSIPKKKSKISKKVQSYWSDLRQKKIKTNVLVELDAIIRRDKKVKFFREEFRKQQMLDSI